MASAGTGEGRSALPLPPPPPAVEEVAGGADPLPPSLSLAFLLSLYTAYKDGELTGVAWPADDGGGELLLPLPSSSRCG